MNERPTNKGGYEKSDLKKWIDTYLYLSLIHIQMCIRDRCKTIHRDLSEYVYPFKHYEADIIDGVVEGLIGPDTLGYEDFPCEETMKRWKKQCIKPRL